MSKQRRLGKGIDALLQGRDLTQLESGDLNSIVSLPIDRLKPNPDQPRKVFTPESLAELARSIEERGIIQPILAEEQSDGDYLIIAGERRYRAAKMAGLTVVPILPGLFSDDEKLEIALIENIQRQDLTPIEEARAYRDLMERSGSSQEELARRLGKSRPAVANSLRLLRLPESVQDQVNRGTLSGGHARTLLSIEDAGRIDEVASFVAEEGLSVRLVERLIPLINDGRNPVQALETVRGQGRTAPPESSSVPYEYAAEAGSAHVGPAGRTAPVDVSPASSDPRKTVEMEQIEQQLIERLGTRVVLSGTNRRGKIEISYLSMDDLERLAEILISDV
ncbi:MAG: ParB/RepB/Spo0J family partition protein [Spirochaetales bacterium]|nr:ParB/RepB/Spo0J family partition protein [Spirochaetales bacterium]